jgi:hypothetical protein
MDTAHGALDHSGSGPTHRRVQTEPHAAQRAKQAEKMGKTYAHVTGQCSSLSRLCVQGPFRRRVDDNPVPSCGAQRSGSPHGSCAGGKLACVLLRRPRQRCRNLPPDACSPLRLCWAQEAFERFDKDPDSKVAVLTGGGGTFCAGADLKAFAGGGGRMNELTPVPASATDGAALGAGRGPMGPSRALLSKPVIAAVAGYAVAGGLELALWADMRVAEEDAVLGVFCRCVRKEALTHGLQRLPACPPARRHMLPLQLAGRLLCCPVRLVVAVGGCPVLLASGRGVAAPLQLQ